MDIEALADQSANTARLHRLRMPAAVRMVLKERGLSNKPNAEELVTSVCRELQKRSIARRKKNGERKHYALNDMFATIAERGGDLND